MHYLDELNSIQRQAVTTTEGPVLIIAGPGSGKTRVLTYRIAHLIESGVKPWEILSLTFTNKSAREMKDRIENVVGDRAQGVWAGTFHSIFARFLRYEAEKIGFPTNFSIYDTDDSRSLLRSIIKEMSLDPKAYHANAVHSRISLAKNNLITPPAYKENAQWMTDDRAAKRPYIQEIYAKYVSRCKRAGAMDFDDLLLNLWVLFRVNPENVKEKYQKKFSHIMVDEFQDTNFLQYAILKHLVNYDGSPQNICVVGDDAQSIYAFRGATIDNILDFEKDYNTLKTYKLEQNYRSTHHIVQAANEVISFNKKQLKKTIFTKKEEREKIKVLRCSNDDEEGRRVADLVMEHKNRYHIPNEDIAILYRTNAQSRKFEDYLRRYNIPYRVYGGLSFYQRKEVKDLIAYLRLTVNHSDEEAMRRVLNYPTRGIGASSMEKLADYAAAADTTLWDSLDKVQVPTRTHNTMVAFKLLIEGFATKMEKMDAYKLAVEIAKKSKLLDNLKGDTSNEGISRLENVNALLDSISEFVNSGVVAGFENGADRSLPIFLQSISLVTDADKENQGDEVVTLMSVHSAKGLEFRSVFVTGLEEDLFPSFMSRDDPNGLDEERRLFYVAITRAKEFLTLSLANERYRYGTQRSCSPSRFLEEIPREHLDIAEGIGSGRKRSGTEYSTGNPRSSVQGNFSMPRRRAAVTRSASIPDNFKAASMAEIVQGAQVLHLKFGKGTVAKIEGGAENKVATIQFEGDGPEGRRIMLRFAKLMVL